jgi:hypothetical protein
MLSLSAAALMVEKPGTIVADEVHGVVYTIKNMMVYSGRVFIECMTLTTDGRTFDSTYTYMPQTEGLYVVSRPAPFSFIPAGSK